jgi:Pentapeptide repeats (8 copies)
MAFVFKERNPPPGWAEFKARAPRRYLLPFYRLSWAADWAAYTLGKWPLVELLEYVGSFSILFVSIFYLAGASDRLKQKHYQAWQVINTAEGKGGNGGRIDALQELNDDRVPLIGVEATNAYLEGLRLEKAEARRANFSSSDLRRANFKGASLEDVDFHWANLRGGDLRQCDLAGSQLGDTDLFGANLAGTDVAQVSLARANLQEADLKEIRNWKEIKAMDQANIFGIRNAPDGFVMWAKTKGAIESKGD